MPLIRPRAGILRALIQNTWSMTPEQNGSSASPRKQASLNGELKSGRTHALDKTEGWYSKSSGSEHLVHDPGAKWKQRFAPQTGQLEWRIEIRSYSCP